jgi:hypothetical protein
MSLSLIIRKTVVCWWLALGTCASLFAQASFAPNFVPNGGEYPVAGLLPGTQVHPELSINTNGGFVVWEDNTIDGNGVGIRAAALDANFSIVPASFRVNTLGARDQEHPRVALLQGGGAVFVWQGGRQGFQHVYARFTSPGNAWLTGDVQVSAFSRFAQRDPSVATLGNGNVIVVWASFNQQSPSSMQDVYGQLFSPSGQKIGGEFLINQTTPYNQRTPSICALNGGGFVVAWVSEQQRTSPVDNPDPNFGYLLGARPSVDIYARIFDVNGSPFNSEFAVNTGFDPCANPSVAAGSDGGFLIAWSQKDTMVRSNSWDIFARSFSRVGLAGPSLAVNATLYGDQYFPEVSALGTQYMIVWTSLGQDGSREGVYGRVMNTDTTFASGEFLVNTTTIGSQMHPTVASDGNTQFLAVWASYVRGGADFDLSAQRFAPPGFVPPLVANAYAPPLSDPFMTNSSNPSVEDGTTRKLNFPNSPPPVVTGVTKGTYQGLFYENSGVTAAGAGYFSATATDKGAFSARFMQRGRTYSVTGQFDSSGLANATVKRVGLPSLSVQLQLVAASDQIRGTVSDGTWKADMVADRLVYDRIAKKAPLAGTYTLIIPSDPPGIVTPGGDGFGTVKVDAAGNVLLAATLADGTKVAQKSAVSKQGIWPLYASLYSGGGAALSWIQFASQADSDLAGQLVWVKPSGATGKYYPSGFVSQVTATGSKYTPPAVGTRSLRMLTGTLSLNGGGLSQPLSFPISIDANNKVTSASTNKLTLSIVPSSGLFRGSTINPDTRKLFNFQGALLEKANIGAGFFLGTNQSGQVFLGPAQ